MWLLTTILYCTVQLWIKKQEAVIEIISHKIKHSVPMGTTEKKNVLLVDSLPQPNKCFQLDLDFLLPSALPTS